jgi:hypothetical protein
MCDVIQVPVSVAYQLRHHLKESLIVLGNFLKSSDHKAAQNVYY